LPSDDLLFGAITILPRQLRSRNGRCRGVFCKISCYQASKTQSWSIL